MKKSMLILVIICFFVCIFVGCGECEHDWSEASCTVPKTCRICGATDGDSLGHSWREANCSAPKTCSVCNATVGEPADHNYEGVVHEPTEFEGGYTTYTCTNCGHSYESDYTDALETEFSEGTFVFRADGVAYLYGPGGEVVETYSGWMEETYSIYEIAGSGGCSVPWVEDYYSGNSEITRVIIENGVNPVSTDAWFFNCVNLETIVIGDDVLALGRGMFERCVSLTTIIFSPNSQLKTIDDHAFSSYPLDDEFCWVHMPQFSIPESVTYLGDLPDTDVPVVLHEGLLGIGPNALTCGDVVLPYSVNEVGVGNFAYLTVPEDHPSYYVANNCMIEKESKTLIDVRDGFEIPKDGSILAIGERVFERMDLQQIILPDGLREIGDKAFWNCNSLTSVTMPDGLIEIGDEAFYYCDSLTSVTIPDSVTRIGARAFFHNDKLEDFNIPASIVSIGEHAFDSCYGIAELILPDGLVSIGEGAFYDLDCLKTVYIPATVADIGICSFSECQNLERLTVSPENAEYYVNNNCLIGRTEKILIAVLGDASLPNDGSIKIIGDNAFCAKDQLTAVVVPDGVTDIGDVVFYWCENLEVVVLPVSVAYMGEQCFSHSPNLRIEYKGTIEQWENIRTHEYFAMSGCHYIIKCTDGECTCWGQRI